MGDALALRLTEGAWASLAVGRLGCFLGTNVLRHLEQLNRNNRLVRCRSHAVGLRVRQVFEVFVFAVDLDLCDVAPVSHNFSQCADLPNRSSFARRNLMGLEPVTHLEISAGLHINAKHLVEYGLLFGIGRDGAAVVHLNKAERNWPAIPHPSFGAHSHFGTHLFRSLLALVSFGGHKHRFHEAARRRFGVCWIVERDELNAVLSELLIKNVEVAAPRQAIIPGAENTSDLTAFH